MNKITTYKLTCFHYFYLEMIINNTVAPLRDTQKMALTTSYLVVSLHIIDYQTRLFVPNAIILNLYTKLLL